MIDFIGQGILLSIFMVAAWIHLWRKLAQTAPGVTDAAKAQATKKAVTLIGKWLQ